MVSNQKILTIFIFLLTVCFTQMACSPDNVTGSSNSNSSSCFESGNILVTNSGSDSLVVLKSDGTFKSIAFSVPSASENLYGVAWSAATKEVLVVVDGVDRVMAISSVDCSTRTLITDINLTGTLRGIAKLTSGDILVSETNNVERFGNNGNRVTSGWPLAAQSGATGLSPLASDGFVHCSSTTNVVRTYNSAGTQIATRSSGIAGTLNAMDCLALKSGNIATTWSGTTDTVSIYDASLNPVTSYSNTAFLGAPGGIAERANGNLLIVDRTYNYVVEITSTGTLVGTFGSGVLSTPEFILVVP